MSKTRCFLDINAEGKRLGRIVCEVYKYLYFFEAVSILYIYINMTCYILGAIDILFFYF